MKTEIEVRCAQLLRDLRRRKGFTLEEFESYSKGAIKAVVLGSYERGARAISLARLEQLAALYEVPLEYFFLGKEIVADTSHGRYIFDLRRLRVIDNLDITLEPLRKFLTAIVHRRGDWNGEVISLRSSDIETCALLANVDIAEFNQSLRLSGLLFANEVSAQRSL